MSTVSDFAGAAELGVRHCFDDGPTLRYDVLAQQEKGRERGLTWVTKPRSQTTCMLLVARQGGLAGLRVDR
ncbi:hypothetical protein [Streptomyces sp. NBC_00878]|uniref:hypothetical protein n=1 Tax=Streptomyces sp. NBC_00878 TaxID=2975854 RepID=UPI002257EE0E|nr:hypothetical protein [Streptomyces sp. NBC_00878]MCX4905836.1 hypothetical protein [Streptomyces sp. NBC_00878]